MVSKRPQGFVRQLDLNGRCRIRANNDVNSALVFDGKCTDRAVIILKQALKQHAMVDVTISRGILTDTRILE